MINFSEWSYSNVKKRSLLMLFLYFLGNGAYAALYESIGFAVFNIHIGPDYLPYVFIGFPFISFIVAYWQQTYFHSLNTGKFMQRYWTLIAIGHCIGAIILTMPQIPTWFFGLFLIMGFVTAESLILTGIFLTQSLYDLNELKKRIPLTLAGGALGAMLLGGILKVLNKIPVNVLFLIGFIFLGLSWWSGVVLIKQAGVKYQKNLGKSRPSVDSVWLYLKDRSFLRKVLITFSIITLSYMVVTYLFNVHATQVFNTVESMAAFVSLYVTIKYIMTLLVNVFVFTKLIEKIGSVKMIQLGILNGVISVLLMMLSHVSIYFSLVSRVYFWVMSYTLSMLALQLYYPLIKKRYREMAITLYNGVAGIVGYTLGGLIILVIEGFKMSVNWYQGLVGLWLLLLLIWWQNGKNGFLNVIQETLDAHETIELDQLLGVSNVENMFQLLKDKATQGSVIEKRFVLDCIAQFDVSQPYILLHELFVNGNFEIQMRVIEMVFKKRYYEFDIRSIETYMDSELKRVWIRNLFHNEPTMPKGKLKETVLPMNLNEENRDNALYYMYRYLSNKDVYQYENLINLLTQKDTAEAYLELHPIFIQYASKHRAYNLNKIQVYFEGKHLNSKQLSNFLDLCYVYKDPELESKGLSAIIKQYDIKLLQQSDEALSTLTKQLINKYEETRIEKLTKLYYERETSSSPSVLFDDILNHTEATFREYQKICMSTHPVMQLLKSEVDAFKETLMSVLLLTYFGWIDIDLQEGIQFYLQDPKKKMFVIEMLQNINSSNITLRLIRLLEDRDSMKNEPYLYNVLDIGDYKNRLKNMYRYLGGEIVSLKSKEEMDRLVMLKSIPMFKELRIEDLSAILEIITYDTFIEDEVIMEKGQSGQAFYIVLEGAVGIYLNLEEAPIATVEAGEMIGELGVINNDPRTATVKAQETVRVAVINGVEFIRLMKAHNSISFAVVQTLSRRLSNMLKG